MVAAAKVLRLVEAQTSAARVVEPSCRVADIADIDLAGHVSVIVDGARLQASFLEHVAACLEDSLDTLPGRQVLVCFVDAECLRPVIVGLVNSIWKRASLPATKPAPPLLEAKIDGKRVDINAGDQLTLRCGHASVQLTADGRIVIKGMEIVSRALLSQKIKGGTVNIN